MILHFVIQKNIIKFAQRIISMKYNELHRILKNNGCYPTGKELCGHPEWFSPITGQKFATSHHGKSEVAKGTLKNIRKASGVNL